MDKLTVLADMLQSLYDIYLWSYDSEGVLIMTNCPNQERYSQLINDELLAMILHHAQEHAKPSFVPGYCHTTWIADSLRNDDGTIANVIAFGPFFIDSYPEKTISDELDDLNISLSCKFRLLDLLKDLPKISFTRLADYVTMLHFAVSGNRIYPHELHYPLPQLVQKDDVDEITQIHGTYEAEKEMVRMIREGDLSLLQKIRTMFDADTVGKLANDNSTPLRQMKNTILVSIVIFSRAAIEGGLYPETALTLTDLYFQAIEAANSFQEIIDISATMQQDFVNRVHNIKVSSYSKPVRTMIEYVDLHLEEDIILSNLASDLGYSNYYLTKLFKKETGSTYKEYIREKRLEKAEILLVNTSLSINEIAEKLHFSSTSYFIESFRKKYGKTPSEYRETK